MILKIKQFKNMFSFLPLTRWMQLGFSLLFFLVSRELKYYHFFMERHSDYLVIGSGLAGLTFALKMASQNKVTIITKSKAQMTNTVNAQGGVASVLAESDSFEKHIKDTITTGAGLCRDDVVENFVRQGPARIQDLINWGVRFDIDKSTLKIDLGLEAAHSERRVVHVKDYTGRAIEEALLSKVRSHKNIEIFENSFAIDLITNKKINPLNVGDTQCLGAYVFNSEGEVTPYLARATILATGGAGKIYLYTSNWDGATGDGIAMAYRAGARVGNLEFMQFHPTCLYHPSTRNFLISEAVRGEGGELINKKGIAFMKNRHPMGSLAPRDVVAKFIDSEMKMSGADCVYLDITHKSKEFLQERFPVIYQKCATLGIFMDKDPIPVVPAAHYSCGGILTNVNGETDIRNLYAIGETAMCGLHGANRLASNSLLECMAMAHNASSQISTDLKDPKSHRIPEWIYSQKQDSDELVVISHMWDEIRRLMWNYVGIVRSNKRLERAQHRLDNLVEEIRDYYWNFCLHPDVIELRNLALVSQLTVRCALRRKESRGIHYNLDYPETLPEAVDTII